MGFMNKSNEGFLSRKTKAPADPNSGNSLSILLLIIPIVSLVIVANSNVILPIDQAYYTGASCALSALAFAVLAYFSFRNAVMSKTLKLVLTVLFVFWMIGNFFVLAKLNMDLDVSPVEKKYVKVVNLKQSLGSSSGTGVRRSVSRSCTVWLDKKLADMDYVQIRYDMCDEIEVQKDGLMLDVRQGYFKMPWVSDYSVIKNFDGYIEKLSISRDE